jgi:hypothetical protein
MDSGLFVTLYDEKTLSLYLKYGIYGFLMSPVLTEKPSLHSNHYRVLADYACCRDGTHIFFFVKRKIVYGGIVKGQNKIASFYLNGKNSPLGRIADAELFWDESQRYEATDKAGVFLVNDNARAQPFILQFKREPDLTGKQIPSDDLYFELGKYPYPLPSNSIQGMGFCTITPGEVAVALDLLSKSKVVFGANSTELMNIGAVQKSFDSKFLSVDNNYQNEAHLEFSILADLDRFSNLFSGDNYIICRQVPICPFKSFEFDRADICLYSLTNSIAFGTIPNIIIELKNRRANYRDYAQVVRYLKWIEKVAQEDFKGVHAYIIAPSFFINKSKIDDKYQSQIKLYSINEKKFYVFG